MLQDYNFHHTSVLFNESIDALQIKENGIYVDCTLGGAGHSQGILAKLTTQGTLLSLDKDNEALIHSNQCKEKFYPKHNWIIYKSDFSHLEEVLKALKFSKVDGILADLGVSSHQLDTKERGFSFVHNGPLDMRMDVNQTLTAEKVVNTYDLKDLSKIFWLYGEEPYHQRVAERIVEKRKQSSILTTEQLAQIILQALPNKVKNNKAHPARRCFQGLRIEVNQELRALEKLLEASINCLSPQGRLAIITFHSLEDKIVKEFFRTQALTCTCPREFPVCICDTKAKGKVITKKAILPSQEELKRNTRSHSAKLRVFERGIN